MSFDRKSLWEGLYNIIGDRDKTDAVLAVLQEHEAEEKKRRLQRQRQGLEKAVESGTRLGRPKAPMPKSLPQIIDSYRAKEISSKEAAGKLGVTLSTFYRYLKKYKSGWE